MDEVNIDTMQQEAVASVPSPVQVCPLPLSYMDSTAMNKVAKTAQTLSRCELLPDMYRGKWENVMMAMDIASRTNMGLMMVCQNLYIVKGKPAWSGSFCAAAINGCGKFTPLEYVFVGEEGSPSYGCFARATRRANNSDCVSETITMRMAQDEGWLGKSGSKWKTMPRQMMMYRAASFFARAHCPEVLFGIQTAEEVQDVREYDEPERKTTTVVLDV